MPTIWESGDVILYLGDCLEVLPTLLAGSIDLVCTDPPYPREFEKLYEGIAIASKVILRPGGSLVTLCGHYQLARILAAMDKHLRYRWMVKLDQPGAHAKMLMGIEVTWKPMAWFTNGPLHPQRNVIDCCASRKRSKSDHPWQQDLQYAEWAIESLTDLGDLVVDPCLGSGTTGVVCAKLGRRFIGVEIDANSFEKSKKRIGDAQLQMRLL